MKKTLLCLLSVICLSMNAQTFELKHEGAIVSDGDIITISSAKDILGDWKMKCSFLITNISEKAYSMRMLKTVIQETENSSNTMCWDQCMEPDDVTAICSNINPQETSDTCYGELWANANGDAKKGTTIVNYTFMTSSKGDPQINVEVHYEFDPNNTSGITTETVNNVTTVKAINGTIEIYSPENKTSLIHDITGRMVKSIVLNQGMNYVDNLPSGVYIIEKQKVIL